MTNPTEPHRPTLMTVHAHPDDETIGTGGAMAKAVDGGPSGRPGHRHAGRARRDRRPRHGHAGQPSPPRRDPGRRARAGDGDPRRHRVGEPRLPRLRDDGHRRQPRPALVLDGRPRRGGPTADLARAAVPAGRHDHLQRVRRLRASRPHPDPRCGGPGVRPSRRPGLVPGAVRGARAGAVGAVEAVHPGDPGVGPREDQRRR